MNQFSALCAAQTQARHPLPAPIALDFSHSLAAEAFHLRHLLPLLVDLATEEPPQQPSFLPELPAEKASPDKAFSGPIHQTTFFRLKTISPRKGSLDKLFFCQNRSMRKELLRRFLQYVRLMVAEKVFQHSTFTSFRQKLAAEWSLPQPSIAFCQNCLRKEFLRQAFRHKTAGSDRWPQGQGIPERLPRFLPPKLAAEEPHPSTLPLRSNSPPDLYCLVSSRATLRPQ
ncbi:hypothetical protein Landi51_12362 [Colletotrichum acutatum]